jgi:hypothetical protein
VDSPGERQQANERGRRWERRGALLTAERDEDKTPSVNIRMVGETCRREAHRAARCGVAMEATLRGRRRSLRRKRAASSQAGIKDWTPGGFPVAILGGDAGLAVQVNCVDAMVEVAMIAGTVGNRRGEKAELKSQKKRRKT